MIGATGKFLREHWLAAMTGVIGLMLGAIVSDFGNFRAANRDIAKRQIEASEKADHDMNAILQKFADKALGKADTTVEDLRILKSTVKESFAAAERLKYSFPKAGREVDQFGDALVTLQKSAELLTGPADGKAFVRSVSRYYVAKKNLEEQISSAQTRWLPI